MIAQESANDKTIREVIGEVADVITFENAQPTGRADVRFPTAIGCTVCGGVKGLIIGDLQVYCPKLAYKVGLIHLGYILRVNEERAARGAYRDLAGHEAWPDSWQGLNYSEACTCCTGGNDGS